MAAFCLSVCQEDLVRESTNMLLTHKHVRADLHLQVQCQRGANARSPRWRQHTLCFVNPRHHEQPVVRRANDRSSGAQDISLWCFNDPDLKEKCYKPRRTDEWEFLFDESKLKWKGKSLKRGRCEVWDIWPPQCSPYKSYTFLSFFFTSWPPSNAFDNSKRLHN